MTKSVQFDLNPSTSSPSPPPKKHRHHHHRTSSTPQPAGPNPKDEKAPSADPSSFSSDDSEAPTLVNSDRPPRRRRHHRHRRSRSHDGYARSPSPTGSDATIELPDRFDEQGRKKPERGEDPLADKIDEFLSGKGKGGKWLSKLLGEDSGDENAGGEGEVGGREYRDRERERRRRRRRG